MKLERRDQVEASEDSKPVHTHEEHADEKVSFSGSGQVPPVVSDVAPVQPSASERAFEGRNAPRVRGGEPVLDKEVRRNVHGITIVAPAGTHASAIDRVAEIVRLEVGRNQFAQNKLSQARTTIVIIPARTPMTEVDEFSSLEGKKTFDGRPWEGVRGSGGLNTPEGEMAIGVAEENLINVAGVKSEYASGYSIAMHEFAHALEGRGLTDEQRAQLEQLYEQQKRQDSRFPRTHHDAFTDNYSAKNKREYFAQSTNAFFGKNAGSEKVDGKTVANNNGREWLRQNDPDMYAFLVDLYETNRDAAGNRTN